ncbi:phosphoenolpyruvate-protein phosphotransferase [Catenulispora acidiphila DSM 44928]|uniref:Phosphoenolpyruvate-protein phosphotransferase n=1 Tax=Catenulispora acidiphila (strain DSM 44928 / JCM 14897 / NBRC 102108 / NRRL B-24433 / ID139908) TaxID=479433 RepID=C7QIN9_CATAD|nr:phosphoenolpyruvate--protein phosphotransferase [Catenulispora acidiphila]ACU76939.1 phosphoenolpyruvate-protein phosphotransferase [Catenulispora acidiphila DSM 44928]
MGERASSGLERSEAVRTAETAEYEGVGVGTAAVAGPVARMGQAPPEPPDVPAAGDPAEECAKALAALAAVAADLRARGTAAGGATADVLEAQAMIAEDPELADGVRSRTDAGKTAARAVHETFAVFHETFAALGDYMAGRVADLDDIAARAVAVASGVPVPGPPCREEPYVLLAADLAPADTALLDRRLVLALVTAEGGPTSHTAILARAMGIPAVVGAAGVLALTDGTPVLVDAAAGTVVAHPSTEAMEAAIARCCADAAAAALTGPGRTSDGTPVKLLANIGGPEDVPAALVSGAEGVGLFRTEFLYLDTDEPPTFDAQVKIYKEVFDAFGEDTRVVVRTLDAGADKPLPFVRLGEEPNPALGVRGLRAFRAFGGRNEAILRTQLLAIREAAGTSAPEVWVMAPMVDEVTEAEWFCELAAACGLDVAGGRVGIMVETPASALTAGAILAGRTGFASIGTNDLTQYTMAADRVLGAVGALQDPWHPAVLQLIGAAGSAGAAAGKPLGVCGEAAADPLLACVLVGLGVRSLSMAPSAIAEVRAALAARSLEDCTAMAARAAGSATAWDARKAALRS